MFNQGSIMVYLLCFIGCRCINVEYRVGGVDVADNVAPQAPEVPVLFESRAGYDASDCDRVIRLWSNMGGILQPLPVIAVGMSNYVPRYRSRLFRRSNQFNQKYFFRFGSDADLDWELYRQQWYIDQVNGEIEKLRREIENARRRRCCKMRGVTCIEDMVVAINWKSSGLQGSVSPDFRFFVNLQTLDLSYNQLTGPIPKEIGQLWNLEQLDLSGNQLSGFIPNQIGNLRKLRYLYLANNELSGMIPPDFGELKSLEHLDLRNNHLVGSIPESMKRLSVSLEGNNFDSNVATGHNSINNLHGILTSTDCYWVVRIWESFGKETTVNPYSSTDCCDMEGVKCVDGSVTEIIWDGVKLRGAIPKAIGHLEDLRVLSFHDSLISGIPSEIGNLKKLETLYALTNTNSSDLSKNYIRRLPKEIGNLESLNALDISENRMFSFPEEIGNLKNLKHLWINNNWRLFQKVAPEFLRKLNLESLRMSGYYDWLGLGGILGGRLHRKVSKITGLEGSHMMAGETIITL